MTDASLKNVDKLLSLTTTIE